MTYLVTGAAGLLGSHLTEMLVARGERPRALLRPGERVERLDQSRVEVCRGDMTDERSLVAALDGVDHVLHCAARTGPWGDAAEYERVNVRGLRLLVQAATAAGARRIVHVSSITVHGNDLRGSADETAPLRAEPNPYSRSKVAGERLLAEMVAGGKVAPVSIVRPGWIYGPGDEASFGRFAALVEQGRMIMMGSGDNHVPLVHVDDVVRGMLQVAESDVGSGKAYLLVNDEPVTQRAYLAAIASELGVPAPTRHIPYPLALALASVAEAAGHALRRRNPPPVTRFGVQLLGGENRFSITRARRELGFAPQVMLAEGVRRSVEWYRASRPPLSEARQAA